MIVNYRSIKAGQIILKDTVYQHTATICHLRVLPPPLFCQSFRLSPFFMYLFLAILVIFSKADLCRVISIHSMKKTEIAKIEIYMTMIQI